MIALAKSKTKGDLPGRMMEAFDLYSPEIDADPFPYYEILREQYPCYWSESGKLWILSRYDDIYRAEQSVEDYSVEPSMLLPPVGQRRPSPRPAQTPLPDSPARLPFRLSTGRVPRLREGADQFLAELFETVSAPVVPRLGLVDVDPSHPGVGKLLLQPAATTAPLHLPTPSSPRTPRAASGCGIRTRRRRRARTSR